MHILSSCISFINFICNFIQNPITNREKKVFYALAQLWKFNATDSTLENKFSSRWEFEDKKWKLPSEGVEGYIEQGKILSHVKYAALIV